MRSKFLTTIFILIMIVGILCFGYAVQNAAAEKTVENEADSLWGQQSWDPIEEMEHAQKEINQIFKESFSRAGKDERALAHGKDNFEVNVTERETKSQFIISADLPGMNKEDINIELKDQLLTISGQRKNEMKTENEKVLREEQNFGSFSSEITLPENVNTAAISAEYKNGVLTVTMPLLEMTKKSGESGTKIPIK